MTTLNDVIENNNTYCVWLRIIELDDNSTLRFKFQYLQQAIDDFVEIRIKEEISK